MFFDMLFSDLIHNFYVFFRDFVSKFSCISVVHIGLSWVLIHTFSFVITKSQVVDRLMILRQETFLKNFNSSLIILITTLPRQITLPDKIVRLPTTHIRRLLKIFESLAIVLRYVGPEALVV